MQRHDVMRRDFGCFLALSKRRATARKGYEQEQQETINKKQSTACGNDLARRVGSSIAIYIYDKRWPQPPATHKHGFVSGRVFYFNLPKFVRTVHIVVRLHCLLLCFLLLRRLVLVLQWRLLRRCCFQGCRELGQ
jgi:hypothetical protein